MEKKTIVFVAMPDAMSIDVTGPCDVFALAGHLLGLEHEGKANCFYELIVASPTTNKIVATSSGIQIACQKSIFEIKGKIDTLIIGGAAHQESKRIYPELVGWIKEKHKHIRRLCSVCIGAFVLAETGLLNECRATTHWQYWQELAKKYERVNVDPDPIFIKEGSLYTSAGVSAGIDLALALVEEDMGRELAMKVAESLVLYLRRPGNQSQFSSMLTQQISSRKQLVLLQKWIIENLKENLSIDVLAGRAAMSPRNFARVFAAEVKLTPAKYVERLRIESSRRYLEESDLSIEQVAAACGFENADRMRNVYLRILEMTPYAYKTMFRNPLEDFKSIINS